MSDTIPYKMIEIPTTAPTKDGGLLIVNNFKTLADLQEITTTNTTNISSNLITETTSRINNDLLLQSQIVALSGDFVTLNTNQDISGSKSFNSGLIVNGSILPTITGVGNSLGSLEKPWDELYVSNNSIHIGTHILSDNGGSLSYNGAQLVTINDVQTPTISSNGYGTRYIQTGTFSDPGGNNGDMVIVI